MISPEYLELNKQLHKGAGWGKGGVKWADEVENFASCLGDPTILDYGCGKGALVEELRNRDFVITGYDPAYIIPMHLPPVDLVVSTDVLEHVEPEYLDSVLQNISILANDAVFLVISLVPAVKVLPDGRNAHLIVESVDWWKSKLKKYFTNNTPESVVYWSEDNGTLVYKWVRG